MNEVKKYLKERTGNTGHVIPHFDGTFPSPDSLSPQFLTQTAGYTQSVANLARGTVRPDSSRGELRRLADFRSLRYGTIRFHVYIPVVSSVYLSVCLDFLTAVTVFRKPNAIPLFFSIDLVLNLLLSWLLVLLPSAFFLDVLFSFSPTVSKP